MPAGADVRSIATLREFVAAVQVYRAAVGDAVGGVNQEVRRAVDWVAEQGQQWSRAVRECEEALTQAKAELAARRFPGFDGRMPDTTLQERNVRRAAARLDHATDRVKACKGWVGRLSKLVDEAYTGKAHRLQTFLDADMARGLADLGGRVDALERYAEAAPDFAPAPVTPAAPPPAPEGGAS